MIGLGSKQLRKRVWSSISIISGTILPRYLLLFFNAMRDSEKSDKLATRLAILNDFFTYLLYCNISRSLFEKDKMLLSLLICTTLWKRFGKLAHEDFTFFATGGIWIGGDPPKNPLSWIADKLWIEMLNLSTNKAFKVNKFTTTKLMFWYKNMIGV
jgi:dynein heavy chain